MDSGLTPSQGEVGIPKTVIRSPIKPHGQCFLIMEQCGAEYIGEMSLDDPAFCREMFEVLIQYLGDWRDRSQLYASVNAISANFCSRLRQINMIEEYSDAFVFSGATGDLAYKQIFPAQALIR